MPMRRPRTPLATPRRWVSSPSTRRRPRERRRAPILRPVRARAPVRVSSPHKPNPGLRRSRPTTRVPIAANDRNRRARRAFHRPRVWRRARNRASRPILRDRVAHHHHRVLHRTRHRPHRTVTSVRRRLHRIHRNRPSRGARVPKPVQGTTERAYREWIGSLGPLSARQRAQAETIYVLAASLDVARESGEASSAIAANARELRQAASEFREGSTLATPVDTTKAPAPKGDGIDEIGVKRAARLRKVSGGEGI